MHIRMKLVYYWSKESNRGKQPMKDEIKAATDKRAEKKSKAEEAAKNHQPREAGKIQLPPKPKNRRKRSHPKKRKKMIVIFIRFVDAVDTFKVLRSADPLVFMGFIAQKRPHYTHFWSKDTFFAESSRK